MNAMKKKMSLFSKIYIFTVAFLLMLLIATSVFLWTVLEAFESVQPKYTAEQVFSEYFDAENAERLLEFVNVGNGFESDEVLCNAIKSKLENRELEYFSVTSGDDNIEKYAVTADGERIAYFTLTKTGEIGNYGLRGYEPAGVEFFMPKTLSVDVTVPEGYSLKLNGIQVKNDKISVDGIPYKSNEFLPEEEKGKFYNKFTVDDFYFEPEIEVFNENGQKVEAVKNTENGEYFVDFQYDSQLQNLYSKRAIQIASLYTKVMSEDAPKSELYSYIDRKSDFYKKVKNSATSWFWDHDGCTIKNESATEFVKYSDTMFSCRVKLTQELYLGKKTEINNVDLVLYMKKIDGVYLLYNAVTNG